MKSEGYFLHSNHNRIQLLNICCYIQSFKRDSPRTRNSKEHMGMGLKLTKLKEDQTKEVRRHFLWSRCAWRWGPGFLLPPPSGQPAPWGTAAVMLGTRDLRLMAQLTRLKGAQPGQKGDRMDRTSTGKGLRTYGKEGWDQKWVLIFLSLYHEIDPLRSKCLWEVE